MTFDLLFFILFYNKPLILEFGLLHGKKKFLQSVFIEVNLIFLVFKVWFSESYWKFVSLKYVFSSWHSSEMICFDSFWRSTNFGPQKMWKSERRTFIYKVILMIYLESESVFTYMNVLLSVWSALKFRVQEVLGLGVFSYRFSHQVAALRHPNLSCRFGDRNSVLSVKRLLDWGGSAPVDLRILFWRSSVKAQGPVNVRRTIIIFRFSSRFWLLGDRNSV